MEIRLISRKRIFENRQRNQCFCVIFILSCLQSYFAQRFRLKYSRHRGNVFFEFSTRIVRFKYFFSVLNHQREIHVFFFFSFLVLVNKMFLYFIAENNNVVPLTYWFHYESWSALSNKKKGIIDVRYCQCYYVLLLYIQGVSFKDVNSYICYNNYTIGIC